MRRDAITGLVVLATSLFLFWATLGLERNPMVPVGPGFYPQLVLGVTAVLAALLLLAAILQWRRGESAAIPKVRPNYALTALIFGLFAVYVLAMPYLGFRVATLVFLAAMQSALEPPRGARRWVTVIVVALVATAATYLVFERYLQVLLPRGRWTGF